MAETKEQFLARVGDLFRKVNPSSYVLSRPFIIPETEISIFTNGILHSNKDARDVFAGGDEDLVACIHTAIMGNIVGWGVDFQGSYPDQTDLDIFSWNLDWGEISLDDEARTIIYDRIYFYREA